MSRGSHTCRAVWWLSQSDEARQCCHTYREAVCETCKAAYLLGNSCDAVVRARTYDGASGTWKCCFSLLSALASICRIRSRDSLNLSPSSASVRS